LRVWRLLPGSESGNSRSATGCAACTSAASATPTPDDLALALLAVRQGGLHLVQIERRTRPLEVALDTMLDHIESLTVGSGSR
jgi:hypothetical protein